MASRFSEPIPNGVTYQLDNRFDPNLSHQCSAVRLDGLNADTEILGDLFIPMPLRQQLHDLTLARGQPRRRCCNTRLAARAQKTLEYRLRNLRAKVRLTPQQCLDSGDDVRFGIGFEQITPRPGVEHLMHE